MPNFPGRRRASTRCGRTFGGWQGAERAPRLVARRILTAPLGRILPVKGHALRGRLPLPSRAPRPAHRPTVGSSTFSARVEVDGSITLLGRGVGLHQHGRREGLPGRGRGGPEAPSRHRGLRRGGYPRHLVGEAITAVVQAPAGVRPDPKALIAFTRERLAAYAIRVADGCSGGRSAWSTGAVVSAPLRIPPTARLHADAELLARPPGLPNAVPPFVPVLSTRPSVDEVLVVQRVLRIHRVPADAAGHQNHEQSCRRH